MIRTSRRRYFSDWASFPWVGLGHIEGDEGFNGAFALLAFIGLTDLLAALLILLAVLTAIFVLKLTLVWVLMTGVVSYFVAGQVVNMVWKTVARTKLF